jgi:hypothetical protein
MKKVKKEQKSVFLFFRKLKNLNFEFQLEDKESSSFRPLLENRMKQKGDTIELLGSGRHMQYYIDFHQEIYVQSDRNKIARPIHMGTLKHTQIVTNNLSGKPWMILA